MSLLFSTGVIAASGLAKGAPGMVLLTPTSITHSGTSASIGANGQVTFTAVTSLSLNGVFSADFDNYVVSIRFSASTNINVQYRLRAAGSDNSTASSYTYQLLAADNTTVSGERTTSNLARVTSGYNTQRNGSHFAIYGPFLAQPTAARAVSVTDYLSAYVREFASTHNQSTSYDGITLFPDTGNITGALTVMGVRS